MTASPTTTSEPPVSPWWDKGRHADRRVYLRARATLAATTRDLFRGWGFTEVDTPGLQISPGNEAHLHAFASVLERTDGSEIGRLHLRTSPEFAAKKLLAAGEPLIFELGHVWRNRERGPLHHPEFTLLEWYRAEAPLNSLVTDAQALLAAAAGALSVRSLRWRGLTADPLAPFERLTVADAFMRFAGVDLLATTDASGATNRAALAAAATRAGVRVAADDHWTDIVSRILVERIEPRLGLGRVTVLEDYPVAEAALARRTGRDPRVAERFELYACGVELANAFGELTDAHEQRRRFEAEMNEMERVHGRRYPLDEGLLAALGQMPPSSGIALGFDRLLMLLTGADHIERVLWAPVEQPAPP